MRNFLLSFRLVAICGLLFASLCPLSSVAEELPNILVIITDDQRYDDLDDYMPVAKAQVFDKGLRFGRGYVTTPVCCPSRASILTGLYSCEHRVTSTKRVLEKETVVQRLHSQEKYYTGITGKYLNSWDGSKRDEFDYWAVYSGAATPYINPEVNVNGEWKIQPGYITDILRDHTLTFLDEAKASGKPFLFYLSVSAPHGPTIPDTQDTEKFLNTFSDSVLPNFNEGDMTDKPAWLRQIPRMSQQRIRALRNLRIRERQTLASVDRAIESVFSKMESLGQFENTAIFFISDNGKHSGEHRLAGKGTVYEESIKVPFAFRYDDTVEPGSTNRVVANIDIAPTIYELTNTAPPYQLSGQSLLGLAKESDRENWRESILVEGWKREGPRSPFAAIVTEDFIYVKNARSHGGFDRNRTELYDMTRDPYQLHNLTHAVAYDEKKNELRAQLNELLDTHRGYRNFRVPPGVDVVK